MKRTSVPLLALLLGLATAVGVLLQQALASAGQPAIIPPITLTLVLVALAVIVLGLAVPIWRAVKDAKRRVDPFYAIRVLILAKSSALSGAILGGLGLGFVVFTLTRPVAAVGSVGYSVGMTVSAIILLIAGLVAELMCRIPPEDEEEEEAPAGAAT